MMALEPIMSALANEIFDLYTELYDRERHEDMSLQNYLHVCRDDPMMYASA